ncbi:MAG: glycosyltransferase family 2 protein [Lachnospiraceae bacterium]|nr:glycosyltransferase family 2 protein [Lachnospiraceae bacterium]
MKINLVMPMGGAGTRFSKEGYECPKPLIDLKGKPFFYWAAMSVIKKIDVEKMIFVILQDHADRFDLDKKILEYFPEAVIHYLPKVLNGAVYTCLEGAKYIDNDKPVIFCDCDLKFESTALNEFYAGDSIDADGSLVTFNSDRDRYSYVKKNDEGYVIETAEKKVISNEAICGAYGFRSAGLFIGNSEEYVKDCPYNECFMSGVYNVMIKKGLKVRSFMVDDIVSFGTPEELNAIK